MTNLHEPFVPTPGTPTSLGCSFDFREGLSARSTPSIARCSTRRSVRTLSPNGNRACGGSPTSWRLGLSAGAPQRFCLPFPSLPVRNFARGSSHHDRQVSCRAACSMRRRAAPTRGLRRREGRRANSRFVLTCATTRRRRDNVAEWAISFPELPATPGRSFTTRRWLSAVSERSSVKGYGFCSRCSTRLSRTRAGKSRGRSARSASRSRRV